MVKSCIGTACLLQHIFEGKIEGTARQGRRNKQQLGKHKEMRAYCKLTEEAPDCTVWRINSLWKWLWTCHKRVYVVAKGDITRTCKEGKCVPVNTMKTYRGV